jgi:hypothetical protein
MESETESESLLILFLNSKPGTDDAIFLVNLRSYFVVGPR